MLAMILIVESAAYLVAPNRFPMTTDPSSRLGQGPAKNKILDISICPLVKISPGKKGSIEITFNAQRRNAIIIYQRDTMAVIAEQISDSPSGDEAIQVDALDGQSQRIIISGWSQARTEELSGEWSQIPYAVLNSSHGPPFLYGFEDKLSSGNDQAIDWNDILVRVSLA